MALATRSDKPITVAELVAELQRAIASGELAPDLPVELEGCDCTEFCGGVDLSHPKPRVAFLMRIEGAARPPDPRLVPSDERE
jgi:hypothetical protein